MSGGRYRTPGSRSFAFTGGSQGSGDFITEAREEWQQSRGQGQ